MESVKRGISAEQKDCAPFILILLILKIAKIYDTIKKNIADKPPVPRLQRMPLKDRSNTSNLNIKEMSKKRSKSLSGFSKKKIFSNNESGKLNFTGPC